MSRPPVTDTHATRRVDCGHGNQGPKRGRDCLGGGRSRWAVEPRQGSLASLLGRSPSLGLPTRTPSEVSLRTEPAGSPVLLKDKDQYVEPLASGPAREEAFLCCVPVVDLPRPPGLERNFRSRPVLTPEVRQHTHLLTPGWRPPQHFPPRSRGVSNVPVGCGLRKTSCYYRVGSGTCCPPQPCVRQS